VCFDTCHVALQFEDLAAAVGKYREAGIRISKCQISAALEASGSIESLAALKPFDEPVYLHQAKTRSGDGAIRSWDDLPPALTALAASPEVGTVRVHFHVPLFLDIYGALRSTLPELTPEFVEAVKASGCEHFEVETYTFDVLPVELRALGVVDCITREFRRARELFDL
jgi:hypothetical protein